MAAGHARRGSYTVGCAVLIAIAAVVALGWLGQRVSRAFVTEPRELASLGHTLLTGFAPPPGYVWLRGVDSRGLMSVAVGPDGTAVGSGELPESGQLMLLLRADGQSDDAPEAHRDRLSELAWHQLDLPRPSASSPLEHPVLRYRNRPMAARAERLVVEGIGGAFRVEIELSDRRRRPLLLVAVGTADGFDWPALQSLLSGLR